MKNGIPEICDLVTYTHNGETIRGRVTAYVRKVYRQLPDIVPPADVVGRIIYDIHALGYINEQYRMEERGLPHEKQFCYAYCLPDEATHLVLYTGIEAYVPIADCVFEGVVPWSAELIQQTRDSHSRPEFFERMNIFPSWEWE